MTAAPNVDVSAAWLRRFRRNLDADRRLICFPHAGGSASFYYPVAQALGDVADVVAVQYPGRQDRRSEPCVPTIEEMADIVTEMLRPLADRPLTFFGHSMGASVAFEVARRLDADDIVLNRLFVSGRTSPSAPRPETTHLLDDAGILKAMRALGGTESTLLDDDEVIAMLLPALRNDYRAAETYRAGTGPLLRCGVVALCGDADPKVDADEMRGWAEHTTGDFTLREFRGDHFYLIPHVASVIATVRAGL